VETTIPPAPERQDLVGAELPPDQGRVCILAHRLRRLSLLKTSFSLTALMLPWIEITLLTDDVHPVVSNNRIHAALS
jgi:hypothetical protein